MRCPLAWLIMWADGSCWRSIRQVPVQVHERRAAIAIQPNDRSIGEMTDWTQHEIHRPDLREGSHHAPQIGLYRVIVGNQ